MVNHTYFIVEPTPFRIFVIQTICKIYEEKLGLSLIRIPRMDHP